MSDAAERASRDLTPTPAQRLLGWPPLYGVRLSAIVIGRDFGILGSIFAKLDCEGTPMLLEFILGPLMEAYLRRSRFRQRLMPGVR